MSYEPGGYILFQVVDISGNIFWRSDSHNYIILQGLVEQERFVLYNNRVDLKSISSKVISWKEIIRHGRLVAVVKKPMVYSLKLSTLLSTTHEVHLMGGSVRCIMLVL